MKKHYHFIGIGGIGMSGIAQLLLAQEARVSGSDIKESRATVDLQKSGARVFIGHNASNISGADIVVYSSAIKEDNCEILAAKKQGIPLIKRAQALAQLMRDKSVITVTGSHGKTTTASLASCLLLEAGLNPSVAIGGILRNIDTNAWSGKGEFFVAEADESDGSFLYYQPRYSIITNIDREHLDYYGEFQKELDAFKEFINRTVEGGSIFCCRDNAHLMNLLEGYKKKLVLFGLSKSCDIYPENIRVNGLSSEFDCIYKGKSAGRFALSLGGCHNISNALAVIALGFELGIGFKTIKKALADFKGAKRRLEIKFSAADLSIFDDYAHHPTEIKATLAALRNLKYNRLIAIFQPHRYTRTKLLLDEFSESFQDADFVAVTDIYPASEPEIEGIHAGLICDKIRLHSKDKAVEFWAKEAIAANILKMLKPGDLVVTLGAGDIVKVNDELVERVKYQG